MLAGQRAQSLQEGLVISFGEEVSPGGSHALVIAGSERVLAVANDLGYKTIFWSFAYMDWDPDKQRGADYAYEQVVPYFHDGEIILLHAVSKDNTEALERIITEAKNQGYEFRSLDELQ